jgi:hypothetical protein
MIIGATNIDVIVRLDRTIQYAAAPEPVLGVDDYRMPAFAGMTEQRGRQ